MLIGAEKTRRIDQELFALPNGETVFTSEAGKIVLGQLFKDSVPAIVSKNQLAMVIFGLTGISADNKLNANIHSLQGQLSQKEYTIKAVRFYEEEADSPTTFYYPKKKRPKAETPETCLVLYKDRGGNLSASLNGTEISKLNSDELKVLEILSQTPEKGPVNKEALEKITSPDAIIRIRKILKDETSYRIPICLLDGEPALRMVQKVYRGYDADSPIEFKINSDEPVRNLSEEQRKFLHDTLANTKDNIIKDCALAVISQMIRKDLAKGVNIVELVSSKIPRGKTFEELFGRNPQAVKDQLLIVCKILIEENWPGYKPVDKNRPTDVYTDRIVGLLKQIQFSRKLRTSDEAVKILDELYPIVI